MNRTASAPAAATAARGQAERASATASGWAGQRRSPTSLALVVALHLGAGLLLWQGLMQHERPKLKVLIPVQWIAPAEQRPPEPPPQPAAKPTPARTPLTALPQPLAAPALMLAAPLVAEAPMQDRPVTQAPPAPVQTTVATPPAPPPAAPPKVSLNAPRYLAEPRLNMPLASKRLGEQGLVQLRLHIGVNGELLEATLARSSGFERLDRQALQDIRSARFSPLIDNGRPAEWECIALLSYELLR